MKLLLGSSAFVAIGFAMINANSPWERFWGYFSIIFFGLCSVVGLTLLVPGSSFLRITAEGMTIRSMWRTRFYRWSDIKMFGVSEVSMKYHGINNRQQFVGIEFSETYVHRNRNRVMKNLSRSWTGFEGALPDSYGWDVAELAEHLNRQREHYISRYGQ